MDIKAETSEPEQTAPGEPGNGWEKLLPLLDPVVIDAPHDKSIWQQLEPDLVRWLINTVSKFSWLNHLTLAGIIYIENAGPARPSGYLQALHPFFNWAIPTRYPDMTALEPEEALLAYFGEHPTQRARHAFKAYSSLQFYMLRFLETSPAKQAEFAPWLLPTLNSSPKLRKFTRIIEEKTQQKRKEQAFAVVRELSSLVALGRQRYKWLVDLEAQYQHMAESIRQGQITLPATIRCQDLDNRKELAFRVWDRISWIKAHQEAYGKSVLQYKAISDGALFIQFIGELPETPWFLRAIEVGVLQGPLHPTPQAQRYLQEWQIPYPSPLQTGLLDPGQASAFNLNRARRTATDTPGDSRIIFCIEPLLAGATVGLFVLVCMVQTGMRIGELMQVTLDRECVETGFLPQFSEESDTWVKGPEQTYFRLYPKGSERRERYLVTDQMLKVLKILIDLHERYYGKGSFKLIAPCSSSNDFSHARRFAEKRKFVLQWNGHHLKNHVLEYCLDFLLLEHPCRYPDGIPVRITTHILRHGVAGWLRKQGIPLEDIMALLKQVNITVTDYYSKLSPQDLYAKIGPALTALADLTDIDSNTIRTVEDFEKLVQGALKRYGALRHTLGGSCAVFTPCEVQFRCASCPAFIPHPGRKDEVDRKIAGCQKAIRVFEEESDHLRADVEKAHLRDWERIKKEMGELEAVELVSPTVEGLLTDLGIDSLGNELLLSLKSQPPGLPEGSESHA